MEKAESRKRVCINGNETEIIESGGRSFFALKFDESRIPLYRIKMLENLHCSGLLPMHFLREGQSLHAYYDFGGFLQLKDMVREWAKKGKNLAVEMAETVAALARCLLLAENYLFFCEDFLLHPDVVFVHVHTGQVKLAYVPEDPVSMRITGKFAGLVRDTAETAGDEQWAAYAGEIYRRIINSNVPLSGIEKILRDVSHDIYSNNWPERSALRPADEADMLITVAEDNMLLKLTSSDPKDYA